MPPPRSHPWITILGPSLYCQTFPPRFPDAEFTSFLEVLEALVGAQTGPFAWVVLADALLTTSATQRRMMADAEKRMQPQDRAFCVGTAIVLSSSIARGVVTAVYWLTPPVYPYAFCATPEQGRLWARARLDEGRKPGSPAGSGGGGARAAG
jgi:hypothetical protein